MLTTILTGAGFVVGTMGLAIGSYFLARLILHGHVKDDTGDLAGSVILRVSALHGLILALVFAQELIDYQNLRASVVDEATAIGDIYYDIGRYGGPAVQPVQEALRNYVHIVVEKEWDNLATNKTLLAEAWAAREEVYLIVLDLTPTTPREETLRNFLLSQIQHVASIRELRAAMAAESLSPLFWLAAVAGIVLTTIPYFFYRPTLVNIMLLSVYGAFTGLVLFIIFTLINPFTHPNRLDPVALIQLLKTDVGNEVASN